jgi:hypothetical protein
MTPNDRDLNIYRKHGRPLPPWGVVATLQAVLGHWTLQDAANVANVPPERLVKEAEAWAYAAQVFSPSDNDVSE